MIQALSQLLGIKRGDKISASGIHRRYGSKRHVLVDIHGIPLAFILTGGNIHDRVAAIPTINAMIKIGKRRYPDGMAADKGYDSLSLRQELRQRRIRTSIPERVYKKAKRR